MQIYVQYVVDGVVTGAVYGLLALGFIIIYRASRVLNFAEAGIGAFGAYVLFTIMDGSGGGTFRYLAGFAIGLVVATLLGLVAERFTIRPLRRAPALASLIVTVGLLLVLTSVIVLVFGGQIVRFPSPFPRRPVQVGSFIGLDQVRAPFSGVIIVGVLLLLGVGLHYLLLRTRFGLAIRAISDDLDGASEVGIPVGRISAGAWALGSAVGAVASMLFASVSVLTPINLAVLQIKALVVAVFAALVDVRLCVLGGLLLGVIEAVAGGTVPIAGIDQSVGFFALLGILILRADELTERLEDMRAT